MYQFPIFSIMIHIARFWRMKFPNSVGAENEKFFSITGHPGLIDRFIKSLATLYYNYSFFIRLLLILLSISLRKPKEACVWNWNVIKLIPAINHNHRERTCGCVVPDIHYQVLVAPDHSCQLSLMWSQPVVGLTFELLMPYINNACHC